jgi:hypothetical protein
LILLLILFNEWDWTEGEQKNAIEK